LYIWREILGNWSALRGHLLAASNNDDQNDNAQYRGAHANGRRIYCHGYSVNGSQIHHALSPFVADIDRLAPPAQLLKWSDGLKAAQNYTESRLQPREKSALAGSTSISINP
jgi:hypothetical protein